MPHMDGYQCTVMMRKFVEEQRQLIRTRVIEQMQLRKGTDPHVQKLEREV